MNAIDFLLQQHREVDRLFKQIEEAQQGDRREEMQELVRQVCDALVIHTRIEHDVFYPALKQHAETEDLVLEGLEEHHLVKIVLKQLAALTQADERYDAKVKVCQELVKHHVKEEEQKMFPQARKLLDEQTLIQLGEQLKRDSERFRADEPNFTVTMLRETTLETKS